MKKAITYLLLVTAILFAAVTVLPAQKIEETVAAEQFIDDNSVPAYVDTAKVEPRKFNEESIKKYQKDDAYRYDYTPPAEGESLLDRLIRWLFGRRGPQEKTINKSYDILMWCVVAFAAVMLIYFIVGGNFTRIVKGPAKTKAALYNVSDLDIYAIDYDTLIAQALAEKNYRTVVRLYYLQTLKTLTDKNLIAWQPDKTNSQYLNELSRTELKQQFAGITYIYEYVWYGGFDLDETRFKAAGEAFSQFNRSIG